MIIISIFTISGLSIVTLVVAKRLEEKREKPFFISEAISKGDIHIRKIYHKAVHFYSEGKEKFLFLTKKRIPIHLRNTLNKLISFLKEKREQYVHNMRDSRLLKKSDGISEFIKNMSDIEKGNGEINHIYEDSSQDDKKELD
ncbi:MAG: hypothetical protein Q8Q92_01150 [bacterium]|nr:hypothetical protein [bacterium]